jgi:Uma2 family endonuclease
MVLPMTAPALIRYTRADLRRIEALPEYADAVFELLNGRLHRLEARHEGHMPPASYLHSWVAAAVLRLLILFAEGGQLGRVYGDGTGYDLPNGDTLIPDVSFVSSARQQPVSERGLQTISPDLVVEVVSPSNADADMAERVDSYLSAGVRLVWVIYPKRRAVSAYHVQADGTIHYAALSADDRLDRQDVLAGFSAPVAELFPAP